MSNSLHSLDTTEDSSKIHPAHNALGVQLKFVDDVTQTLRLLEHFIPPVGIGALQQARDLVQNRKRQLEEEQNRSIMPEAKKRAVNLGESSGSHQKQAIPEIHDSPLIMHGMDDHTLEVEMPESSCITGEIIPPRTLEEAPRPDSHTQLVLNTEPHLSSLSHHVMEGRAPDVKMFGLSDSGSLAAQLLSQTTHDESPVIQSPSEQGNVECVSGPLDSGITPAQIVHPKITDESQMEQSQPAEVQDGCARDIKISGMPNSIAVPVNTIPHKTTDESHVVQLLPSGQENVESLRGGELWEKPLSTPNPFKTLPQKTPDESQLSRNLQENVDARSSTIPVKGLPQKSQAKNSDGDDSDASEDEDGQNGSGGSSSQGDDVILRDQSDASPPRLLRDDGLRIALSRRSLLEPAAPPSVDVEPQRRLCGRRREHPTDRIEFHVQHIEECCESIREKYTYFRGLSPDLLHDVSDEYFDLTGFRLHMRRRRSGS